MSWPTTEGVADSARLREHCERCGEPIDEGQQSEDLVSFSGGRFGHYHRDCAMRMVIGGLNHLRGRCMCCGGDQPPDPPELSKREAARQACELFRLQNAERRGQAH
jgi:hypothetical protein